MSAINERLRERIATLAAREGELMLAIGNRQFELRAVTRELIELRRAAAIESGEVDLDAPSVESPGSSALPEARHPSAPGGPFILDMVRGLEVGSIAFLAVTTIGAAGRPLHGKEVAQRLNASGCDVTPHTVAVTLGRMAREGRFVVKVSPNTFDIMWQGAGRSTAQPPSPEVSRRRSEARRRPRGEEPFSAWAGEDDASRATPKRRPGKRRRPRKSPTR